jgi:2'-5' RNA ligase
MHLCLAYPALQEGDRKIICEFRRLHDIKYFDVVDAHWTMIFPVSTKDIELNNLADHIARAVSNYGPVSFVCRYALVYDDDGSDDYYLFLVPDEGFSGISLLHDELYSDFMRPHLRLDIPYVPHIGIATDKNKEHLYELAREWNDCCREIRGTIDSLTLSSYDGKQVKDIKQFNFNRSEPIGSANAASPRRSPLR